MMKTSIIQFLSTMGTAEPLRHPTGHRWDKRDKQLLLFARGRRAFWEATQLLYSHWGILYQHGLTASWTEFTPWECTLGLPHTKPVESGLFELRLKSKKGIARICFCTKISKKITMFHSFIKNLQKTPKKEIKITKTRMKEVLENATF